MSFLDFFKTKMIFFILQTMIIIFIVTLLTVTGSGSFAVVFCIIMIVLFDILILAAEFIQKNRFYKTLEKHMDTLDKKYLLGAVVEKPDFYEGEILYDVLQYSTSSMNEEVAKYRRLQEEYQDYVETWIHEIKIPIACINLICENNKSDITKSISDEVLRVEEFVEQALFYARSSALEKDYVVKDIMLIDSVKSVIKKYSKQLIINNTKIEMNEMETIVFADPKWLEFVIGQIIANSIKYKKDNLILSFSGREKNNTYILEIKDNGIGILEKDLSRVFDKGFTGENGREYAKSTGIGMYLCKSLCRKMNLNIAIESEYGIGTTVLISFPRDIRVLLES